MMRLIVILNKKFHYIIDGDRYDICRRNKMSCHKYLQVDTITDRHLKIIAEGKLDKIHMKGFRWVLYELPDGEYLLKKKDNIIEVRKYQEPLTKTPEER